MTFEALSDNGRLLFPTQAWDYEGDKGRGGWAIYSEKLFPVPESKPEVEPEIRGKQANSLIRDEVDFAAKKSPKTKPRKTDIKVESVVRPDDLEDFGKAEDG